MKDWWLISVHHIEEPTKDFIVCDLDEGMHFVDPLTLFSLDIYDPHGVNDDGLYGLGGEITSDLLIESYKWGIFPWYAYKTDVPNWYCPRRRYVIFPNKIHVSHSLRNLINKKLYTFTINKDFEKVINYCRTVNGRDENERAWLSPYLIEKFLNLNKRGFVKSIEVWNAEKLVGGFYGFWHNGVFQGDSMFSLEPSASQIGLVWLCNNPYIDGIKVKFIDTQFETPTFKRLGGEFIDYHQYRQIMDIGEF